MSTVEQRVGITVTVHLIDYRCGPRKAETIGRPIGSGSFLRRSKATPAAPCSPEARPSPLGV